MLKASDGHGPYWTKGIGLADDFEDADGKNVLTFYEAQDAAKRLARGEDCSADSAPTTVDGSLKDYKRDLEARNATPYNPEHPRVHLTCVLLAKPVALLTATDPTALFDGGRCRSASERPRSKYRSRAHPTFGQSSFPIGPGVVIGQVGDQEPASTYLVGFLWRPRASDSGFCRGFNHQSTLRGGQRDGSRFPKEI